jgi:uncharacterized protein (TIGR03032 family)
VVTTGQAGKLIVLRSHAGKIDSHSHDFNQPLALAISQGKMAIGTTDQIWHLRNVAAVAAKLNPVGKYDACYLTRHIHVTGAIDVQEMAFAGAELWLVNTRFSCLCTLDREHSFVPRWRPPFITGYDLGDRCHLNGLAIRNQQPYYVTALGATDVAGGWRQNKARGGILIDVPQNKLLCQGLSLPHSPRWYQEQLWLLESGIGSLAQVNHVSGAWQTVSKLPGFTRGLDFYANFAFIGLSQVRGTPGNSICGIAVVNIQNGETIASLRFDAGITEVFAIQVIPNCRYPKLIDRDDQLLASSFVLPDQALKEVAQSPTTNKNTSNYRAGVQSSDTYFELGNRAYNQDKKEEARQYYLKCLQLQPDSIHARYNLGVVCTELEQWSEAKNSLQQVIAANPNHADAYNYIGIIARRQHQLPIAMQYFRQAIALRYQFPDAHFNLGMTLLQTGDFLTGFAECEWRWQTKQFNPLQCLHPQWQGEDIRQQNIFIHTEQGAGDAMQFIRFLPLVAQQCQQVILCCPDNLVTLFKTVKGVGEIYTAGAIPLSKFSTYSPLMSLPYLLKTTIETIPDQVPYVGVAKEQKDKFAPLFKQSNQFPKIGIVWAGSPTHKDDRNRSCALTDFSPILKLANFNFYSLQKGEREQDLERLPTSIKVVNLSSYLNDFADTAAAITHLDLVISVDTSVVHLAGALGRPVWTLLSYAPDWRWLLERTDTPWYPTMRLFRQQEPGNWQSAIAKVVDQLRVFSQSRS